MQAKILLTSLLFTLLTAGAISSPVGLVARDAAAQEIGNGAITDSPVASTAQEFGEAGSTSGGGLDGATGGLVGTGGTSGSTIVENTGLVSIELSSNSPVRPAVTDLYTRRMLETLIESLPKHRVLSIKQNALLWREVTARSDGCPEG
ncbi:hypothetical protein HOY82DRAFT_538050 [Tuber indicum]|nr:hypothetical protein HOY82DRAFT_538050 [Tuber indicum]